MLPSIRFLLTVHDLRKTQLDELDTFCDQYLKKWLKIPKHGANIAFIHENHGLNIPRISSLYQESHCLAYSRTRLIGDTLVNSCLNSKLDRERSWTHKSSTITNCDDIHQEVVANMDHDTN